MQSLWTPSHNCFKPVKNTSSYLKTRRQEGKILRQTQNRNTNDVREPQYASTLSNHYRASRVIQFSME